MMDGEPCFTRRLCFSGQMDKKQFKDKDKSDCGEYYGEQRQIMNKKGLEDGLPYKRTEIQGGPSTDGFSAGLVSRQRDGKCKGPEVGKGLCLRIRKSPTTARQWWVGEITSHQHIGAKSMLGLVANTAL